MNQIVLRGALSKPTVSVLEPVFSNYYYQAVWLPEFVSRCGRVCDVTFVKGANVTSFLTERSLKLELVDGSGKVSVHTE